MTKPSDFKLNSDYLTLAQTGSTTGYTVYFPPQMFPVESQTMKSFHTEREFTSNATPGATDRVAIVYNGTRYVGNVIVQPPEYDTSDPSWQGQSWFLTIYRKDAITMVARVDYMPPSSASEVPTTPSLTFTISISSFKAPNVL